MKTIIAILVGYLLLGLAGCDRLERDKLAAPDDSQLGRYGLDSIKLGDKRAEVSKQLQALLDQPLRCKSGTSGLGKQRKAFVTEQCDAVPANGKVGKVWDETATQLSAFFVENQLCSLRFQLKTSGDYTALYDKHGQKILNLFGKPDEVSTEEILWQREGDEVTLKALGDGKVAVEIRNKKVMQALHHKSD